MKRYIKICFSSLLVIGLLLFVGCSNSYKVTFETNGGSAVTSIKFKEGEKITKPTDPTKENLEFAGWYSDIDLLDEFDFEQTLEAKNITVYAKWMTKITFNTNGGTTVDPILKSEGDVMQLPTNVTNGELVLSGWYTDPEFTQKANQLYIVPSTNVTLYAKWSGVESGTAINLLGAFTESDSGAYTIVNEENQLQVTANAAKGEWSYVSTPINATLTGYALVYLDFTGTKDINFTIKLEGGGVNAYETTITMTGERQIVRWSVPAENLSTTGGQKLLIFLNGGTVGNDPAATVSFTKIQICKMIDSSETGEQALFFDTLGGSFVPSIIALEGEAISSPNILPTKTGYTFDGWYKDALGNEQFVFDKMPLGPTTVYAKWKENPELDLDYANPVSIMKDFASNDPNNYEFSMDEGNLIVTVTTAKGEWSFFKIPVTVTEVDGAVAIRLVFNGKANDKFMIKINNVDEYTIELKGGIQEEIIVLNNPIDGNMANSVIVFYNGGGTVTENTDLVFTNFDLLSLVPAYDFDNPINIMNNWVANDDGQYLISENVTPYTVTATTTKGEWSFIKREFTAQEVANSAAVRLVFTGVAGTRILVKFNDRIEIRYNVTGQKQEILIELTEAIDASIPNPFIIFYPEGVTVLENTTLSFEVLEILTRVGAVDPVGPTVDYDYKNPINVMNNWEVNDEGTYEIAAGDGTYSVTATTAKDSWSFIKRTLTDKEAENVGAIRLVFTGVAGTQILFKINDKIEKWIDVTGEKQEILIELTEDLNYNLQAPLIMFYPGGVIVTEKTTVTFEAIELLTIYVE